MEESKTRSNNPRKNGVNKDKKYEIHESRISLSEVEAKKYFEIYEETITTKKGKIKSARKYQLKPGTRAKFQATITDKLLDLEEIKCSWCFDGKNNF